MKMNGSKTLLDRIAPSDIAYTIILYKNSIMFGGRNWKSRLLARPKKRGKVQEDIKNQDTIMQVESASNVKVMDGLILAKSTTQNCTGSTKHLRIVKRELFLRDIEKLTR